MSKVSVSLGEFPGRETVSTYEPGLTPGGNIASIRVSVELSTWRGVSASVTVGIASVKFRPLMKMRPMPKSVSVLVISTLFGEAANNADARNARQTDGRNVRVFMTISCVFVCSKGTRDKATTVRRSRTAEGGADGLRGGDDRRGLPWRQLLSRLRL